MTSRKKSKSTRAFVFIILILIIIGGAFAYRFYNGFFNSNVTFQGEEKFYLYIPTGSTFNDVLQILEDEAILDDELSFKLLSEKMNYVSHVHAGRYLIKPGSSNYELIRKLRSGESEPVMVEIDKCFTPHELAGKIGKQLEIDSAEIIKYLFNKEFLDKYHLTRENALCLFIPDSYEFYWQISLEGFFKKVIKQYEKFWTESNINKGKALGLTKAEINILASIVQEEAVKEDEMPRIAGVYINRLNMGKRLEADPTIKFIVRNRKPVKVTIDDYSIDSEYNTYRVSGLPPGPISMSRKSALEAVLNYEKHNYIYFVVKDDNSGYHVFSASYEQHKYYRKLYLKSKNNK